MDVKCRALLCSKWSERIDKMHSKKSLAWQEMLLYNRQKETEQKNPQLQVNTRSCTKNKTAELHHNCQ